MKKINLLISFAIVSLTNLNTTAQFTDYFIDVVDWHQKNESCPRASGGGADWMILGGIPPYKYI